jgi:hypothetical protein
MTLTARFTFELDAPLHIYSQMTAMSYGRTDQLTEKEKAECFSGSRIALKTVVDGIEVQLWLTHDLVDNPLVKGHHAMGVQCIDAQLSSDVDVFTGRETPEYPNVRERYRKVVFTVMNRLIEYFKYEKGNPFLRPLNAGHLKKWEWYDQNDKLLYEEPKGVIVGHFPGLHDRLDSKGLRMSELGSLTAALGVSRDIIVVDELRAQAREAIYEENLLLAVLLLAVAVEVKVKTTFLGSNSAASNAFDYSQEKGRIEVSPVDFIGTIAKRTFGQGFNDVNQKAYTNIQYLFRCRNKVAHRGQGIYSDNNEKPQRVDREKLDLWWTSVTELFTWLADKADTPGAMESPKPS